MRPTSLQQREPEGSYGRSNYRSMACDGLGVWLAQQDTPSLYRRAGKHKAPARWTDG